MSRRVVITGLGTVNPLSADIATYWERLCSGKSGIGLIEPGKSGVTARNFAQSGCHRSSEMLFIDFGRNSE